MSRTLRRSLALAGLATALVLRSFAADAPAPGYVDFGKMLPAEGGKFVEVNLKENLLSFAATIVKAHEPDAAELIKGLKHVRVNVVGLDEKNRGEMKERLAKIRTELESKGWEQTVVAKDNGDDVAIYIKTGKDAVIDGLVVTVLSHDNEAVFVNIVGNIDATKIAALGEKLGIDPLKKIPHVPAGPEKPAPAASAS